MKAFLPAILLVVVIASGANAAGEPEPAEVNTTKCRSGAADILGDPQVKAHTVQVCNLFGATCYVNHPSITADQCATKALKIETGSCALFPILTSRNGVPTMSTVSDYGCSVSLNNNGGKYSATFGASCMSVQCSLGGAPQTWAGPAFSSDTTTRKAVTDTATAPFTAQSFAGVSDAAKQAKTVFLVRTGNYVGTTKSSSRISNGKGYYYGDLPTSDGNNYGPVACPSTGNTLDSAKATAITAADLRMCGNTGKWLYVNGYNFMEDKPLLTAYSKDSETGVGTTMTNIGTATKFLSGKSAYRSGKAMDDSRKIYIKDAAGKVSKDSAAFSPLPGNKAAFKDEVGGTWRSIGVAFYCDDYARTDLTTCKEENRQTFFTCDPNPDACYGTATQISSNKNAIGTKCTDNADCCSGKCSGDAGKKTCEAGCEVATSTSDNAEPTMSLAALHTVSMMAALFCVLVFAAM